MREFERAFMYVVPISSNHILIKGRGDNYLDLTTSMTENDDIYILTKTERLVIKSSGEVRSTP